MRIVVALATSVTLALLAGGCQVAFTPPSVAVTVPSVDVQASAPVIEGGVAVDVVPPPAERVYVYDVGYPPGVYIYNGFYYYHGYRYSRDIFVNHYVHDNIEHHRFADVEANRREGARLESEARTRYARTGGHVEHAGRAREDHTGRTPESHTGRPAEKTPTGHGAPNENHNNEKKPPENTPENQNRTVP